MFVDEIMKGNNGKPFTFEEAQKICKDYVRRSSLMKLVTGYKDMYLQMQPHLEDVQKHVLEGE